MPTDRANWFPNLGVDANCCDVPITSGTLVSMTAGATGSAVTRFVTTGYTVLLLVVTRHPGSCKRYIRYATVARFERVPWDRERVDGVLLKYATVARGQSVRWHTGSHNPMRPVCANVPTGCRRTLNLDSVTARVNRLQREGAKMNSIVYIVGAIVIIVAILSFFGLR